MTGWRRRDRRLAGLASSVLLLAALHGAVSVETHPAHVIHVILGGLYLLPIVAAALWFGLTGGLLTAVGVSAAYLLHVLLSLEARILRVADVFSALTDVRSYKTGLAPREALERMREWGEEKLDGESLRALAVLVHDGTAEPPTGPTTVDAFAATLR